MASEDRESLRLAYQKDDVVASKFIPAKPEADIYERGCH